MNPEIKLGYLFILKDEKDISVLENTLNEIRSESPIWIGVSNLTPDHNTKIAGIIESTNPEVNYNIISNYEDIHDLHKIDQFIKSYKNGWTLVNVVGQEIKKDAKDILDKYINQKEEKICLIVQDKDAEIPEVNNMCYFNFTYVFLKGNLPEYIEEDDSLISKSILDKTRELNPSMIKNWEELT